jgi:hypothetical protein
MVPARRIVRTTREEAETTITFNRHEGTAELCTADPSVMRRWKRVGWPVEVLGRYADREPRTWQTAVPWRWAVAFKRDPAKPKAAPGPVPSGFRGKGRSS